MANVRPTLNLGKTIKKCTVKKSLVGEGIINMTDEGNSNVVICDEVENVKYTTFASSITNRTSGETNAKDPVFHASTSDGAVFAGSGSINFGSVLEETMGIGKSLEFGYRINGHMIIFNQEFKNSEHYRHGSIKDVEDLSDTFGRLGIEPKVKPDLKYKEIVNEIDALSKTDFSACKLFLCVYMSHGLDNGYVYAADREFNLRQSITDPIMGNKSLSGIPKIFILVACRGEHNFVENDNEEFDGCITNTGTGINYSNCIFSYSTYECHVSKRTREGTYFIQSLCESINEDNGYTEIHSIFAKVNGKLAEMYKQFPVFKTTMGAISLRDLAFPESLKELDFQTLAEERNAELNVRGSKSRRFPSKESEFDVDAMAVTVSRIANDNNEFRSTYVFGDGHHKFTIFVETMKHLLNGQGPLREVDLLLPQNELPDLSGKSRKEILDILASGSGEDHEKLVTALEHNEISYTMSPFTKNIFIKNCDWNVLFKISNLVNELQCDLTVSGGAPCEYLGGMVSSILHYRTPKHDTSVKLTDSVQLVKIGVIDSGCSSDLFDKLTSEGNVGMHNRMINATDSCDSVEVDYEDCYVKRSLENVVTNEGHGSGVVEVIARLAPLKKVMIFVANVGDPFDGSNVDKAMWKLFELGVVVVNCSLTAATNIGHFANTLRIVQSAGVKVVAAAQNRGDVSPNAFNNGKTIMVGSHCTSDRVSRFTDRQCEVDVCSHGEGVYLNSIRPNLQTGTSFAAPVVTAAVAHALSYRNNGLTRSNLKSLLMRSNDSLVCECPTHDGMQVNLKFNSTSFIRMSTCLEHSDKFSPESVYGDMARVGEIQININ